MVERLHRAGPPAGEGAASEQKRLAKEAVAGRVQQHVKRTAAGWAIPEGRAIAIDRILAEAALWGLLSYRIPTWAEAHGGKKNNPFAAIHALSDEDLAKELAMEIASDFRDKATRMSSFAAFAKATTSTGRKFVARSLRLSSTTPTGARMSTTDRAVRTASISSSNRPTPDQASSGPFSRRIAAPTTVRRRLSAAVSNLR
jgi:hypothetical protein